jgi:hypothetical protein
MKKSDWAKYLSEAALNIDYPNFKDSIPKRDQRRLSAYLRVWKALLGWQESSRKNEITCADRRIWPKDK